MRLTGYLPFEVGYFLGSVFDYLLFLPRKPYLTRFANAERSVNPFAIHREYLAYRDVGFFSKVLSFISFCTVALVGAVIASCYALLTAIFVCFSQKKLPSLLTESGVESNGIISLDNLKGYNGENSLLQGNLIQVSGDLKRERDFIIDGLKHDLEKGLLEEAFSGVARYSQVTEAFTYSVTPKKVVLQGNTKVYAWTEMLKLPTKTLSQGAVLVSDQGGAKQWLYFEKAADDQGRLLLPADYNFVKPSSGPRASRPERAGPPLGIPSVRYGRSLNRVLAQSPVSFHSPIPNQKEVQMRLARLRSTRKNPPRKPNPVARNLAVQPRFSLQDERPLPAPPRKAKRLPPAVQPERVLLGPSRADRKVSESTDFRIPLAAGIRCLTVVRQDCHPTVFVSGRFPREK